MLEIKEAISPHISYKFKDEALLEEALTHPSVMNRVNPKNEFINNERLEFLGDSVLNMIVTELLFTLYPDEKEGGLTKRKKHLICTKTIASVANDIKLDDFIIFDKNNKVNCNEVSMENALEALIGAIYVDGGFENARYFVRRHWEKLARTSYPEEAKTALIEWTQRNKKPYPEFRTVAKTGPLHSLTFTVLAKVDGFGSAFASASTKKFAEKKTAEVLLERIRRSKAQQ